MPGVRSLQCGNFVSATPDTAVPEAALRACALTVQVSTKLNRSQVVHGSTALILPSLGRTDREVQAGAKQMVSVEDSMWMVQSGLTLVAFLRGESMNVYTLPDRVTR